MEEAERRNIPVTSVGGFTAVHGRGVRASIGSNICFGGNRAMVEEAGIAPGPLAVKADELAAQGKTLSTSGTKQRKNYWASSP